MRKVFRSFGFRLADDSGSRSGVLSDIFVLRSAQFLGESDEKFFRPADIAEPIRGFVLDYFAYELPAALWSLSSRLVDVVHGEHDAEGIQERSPGRCGDPRRQVWREEAGELQSAVAIRRARWMGTATFP